MPEGPAAGLRRFVIRERVACLVDFYREVEAFSEDQALDKDRDGQNNYLGFRVGDSVGKSVVTGVVSQEPDGLVRA